MAGFRPVLCSDCGQGAFHPAACEDDHFDRHQDRSAPHPSTVRPGNACIEEREDRSSHNYVDRRVKGANESEALSVGHRTRRPSRDAKHSKGSFGEIQPHDARFVLELSQSMLYVARLTGRRGLRWLMSIALKRRR